MGLDAGYPAVKIIDPTSVVPIWNGSHTVIGSIGPDDYYHSSAVNVTCTIRRLNGRWHKLWNASGWDLPATSAYVSTALTYVLSDPPENPLHDCVGNTDQPGRRWFWWGAVTASVLAGSFVVARIVKTRLRRPVPPRPSEHADLPGRGWAAPPAPRTPG